MPSSRFFAEGSWIFLCSILGAWLYFVPIFWDMVGGVYSYPSALNQVFIENNSPEFFIGGGIDQLGTLWVFTMAKGIFLGEQSAIISGIYAPYGFDLGINTGFGWADALLSLPLMILLGVPGFYNAHVFFTLSLSTCGMLMLFRMLGATRILALALAFTGLFTPFGIQEIYDGRPTQIHWIYHTLFLCALTRSDHKYWLRWSTIGGVALCGACLTYWFGGAAIGFCGAIVLLGRFFIKPSRRTLGFGVVLATVSLFITLTLTSRVSIPMLKGEGSEMFYQLSKPPLTEIDLGLMTIPVQSMTHVNNWQDLLSLVQTLPINALHWGLFALVLVPFGWRRSLPWTIGLIVAIGIPLTPAIHWMGGMLPTGHALLQTFFPPLPRCEFPLRMVVAPLLIGLSLAAVILGRTIKSIRQPLFRTSINILIAGSLLFLALENRPERGTVGNFQVDGDLIMATRKVPGGIIDVPLERSQNTYVQQIYHQQPILGGPGMNRVRPEGHEEYTNASAFLRGLEGLARGVPIDNPDPKSAERLWNDGFRWIVVHTQLSVASVDEFEGYIGTKGKLDMRTRQLIIPLPNPDKP